MPGNSCRLAVRVRRPFGVPLKRVEPLGIGISESGTQSLLGPLSGVRKHGLHWLLEQSKSSVSVLPDSSLELSQSAFWSLVSHLSAKYTDRVPFVAGERKAINNAVGVPPGTRFSWRRGH